MTTSLVLINKFLNGSISSEEKILLQNWVELSDDNLSLFKEKIKTYEAKHNIEFDSALAFEKFILKTTTKPSKTIWMRSIIKYAAIFIGLITLGFFFAKQSSDDNTTITDIATPNTTAQTVQITLADGTVKVISNTDEENITDSNGVVIANKKDGAISFVKNTLAENNTKLNEIYIPNGQKFQITLADGTQIWLNSGSRLKFPQHFNSSENTRTVVLTGEAFFDVATNKEKPFIVKTNDVNIEVLGTQFNVSSYDTDTAIATTLVEGAVHVSESNKPDNFLKLSPTFQAKFNRNSKLLNMQKVNTANYTAWMQNKLVIDGLKFSEILHKLERSHNVVFNNTSTKLDTEIFKGEFTNENLKTILETISLSTPFNFTIDKNIITITD